MVLFFHASFYPEPDDDQAIIEYEYKCRIPQTMQLDFKKLIDFSMFQDRKFNELAQLIHLGDEKLEKTSIIRLK